MVQRLRLCSSPSGGGSSIPDWGQKNDDDDEIKLWGSKQGIKRGDWSSQGLGKGSLRMSDFLRQESWVGVDEAVEVGRGTNGCSQLPFSACCRLPEAQLKMLNCSWEVAGGAVVGVCSRAWASRPGSWVSLMFGAAGRQPIGAPAAGNSWWGWPPWGWAIRKGCDGRGPLDLEWKGEGVVMDDLKTFRPCSLFVPGMDAV